MAAKPASFPSSVKVGGDVTYSGRILEVAPDGAELLYGDAQALFRLRRGEKALQKIDTGERHIVSASALPGGEVAVGLWGADDEAPRVEVFGAKTRIATYELPEAAVLSGCLASRQAEAIVAWGMASTEDRRLQLWWWPLGSPGAPRVTHTIAAEGIVLDAAFVGAKLFVSAGDELFVATSSEIAAVKTDGGPTRLAGARTGTNLLARVGRSFVVMTTDGEVVHTLPPVLKLAQLTADGRRVVGYGESLDVKTPIDVRERYPEWARTNFVASFDTATGERLGWGKVADSVDALALVDDELIVTKSVKRIAFHPWKLATGQ